MPTRTLENVPLLRPRPSSSSFVLEKTVRWFEDEDEDDGRGRKKTHEITDFVAKANWRFTKRPKRSKSSRFGGASSGSPQIPRVSIRKPGNQEKQIEMKSCKLKTERRNKAMTSLSPRISAFRFLDSTAANLVKISLRFLTADHADKRG